MLHGIDLEVPPGRLTAVLGPSGCGKTTLLRLIAGFDAPDAGRIRIGERTVADGPRGEPPERRGIGYVAQEGALFPHLTVAGNIGFGLPRSTRRRASRVAELLELVGLQPQHAGRYPHQLSGGQQQRVALARALAPRPAVVLLDEPFAALDAGLRAETRHAVVAALASTASTAVLVTPDQAEALSTAHQVAVMRAGRLVQTATPADLYRAPATVWVAGFIGEATVLPATVRGRLVDCALGLLPVDGSTASGSAAVLIRPEQVRIHPRDTGGVPARVERCTYYGHDATVILRLIAADTLVTARCAGQALPQPATNVTLTVDGPVLAYPTDSPDAATGVG
ncbi:MAG: ABC transporter ATP-binding protein [Motilibacteraceae bacterium]